MYESHSYNNNLNNCKLNEVKQIFVNTAVLYPLSYEDPHIVNWPIYWVHFNP